MAKIDSKNIGFIVAVVSLLVAFSAVAKVYFVVPAEVARLRDEIKEIKLDMKEYSNKELTDREDIIQLKTQVKYIREDTGEILTYIKTLGK